MTVLDDPPRPAPSWAPRTASGPHEQTTGARAARDFDQTIDGLSRHAAGPRFRFTDTNPVTGRSYGRSSWSDLPYLIWVLVRDEVRLTDAEWDCLVASDSALDVVGSGEFRIPFTLDVTAVAHRRVGRPPEGVCGDCWGTGFDFDFDASMTGIADALFVCECAGGWM